MMMTMMMMMMMVMMMMVVGGGRAWRGYPSRPYVFRVDFQNEALPTLMPDLMAEPALYANSGSPWVGQLARGTLGQLAL